MLLGISPDYLYIHKQEPQKVNEVHHPYFLAFTPEDIKIQSAQKRLLDQWKKYKEDHSIFSKIDTIGDIETYRSFSNFNVTRDVFKIYTKESYFVPEISDYLFFDCNLFTAEHDIPYHQRALIDLAADQNTWMFDTNGKEKKLNVIAYDIEITKYEEGKTNLPIDIIGYSSFDVKIQSSKNLDTEKFNFELVDIPPSWDSCDVHQLIARTGDEEVTNLLGFCKILASYDIISGHNIAGFDNSQLYGRIKWILKNYNERLSKEERALFQTFTSKYCRVDKSFHFGVGSEVVQIYPSNLDTYLAARKFYPFLDNFSLKAVAPFLGIKIKDRLLLTPSQIQLDARTFKYNKQDVLEQIGVTLHLIQQALPLAFTTCLPFDMLLPSGAVSLWDHMAMIRGAVHKKIMPPICRVKSISQTLVKQFKDCSTKDRIVQDAKKVKDQLSKDFIRVVKYGEEMPDWVLYPAVIYNENAKDSDDIINYHMPGGMTIKPDKESYSHFIPWYYVVVADVGAMYPTILKAMNIGADTVRLARKQEDPDEWIWLKKLPREFLINSDVKWKDINTQDTFADKGYMLGIKIDKSPGVVNLAMTGVMNSISKIKEELKTAKEKGKAGEIARLSMMYQSMKGARNAGTHGILAAPLVTGRQFNLWGAAAITTKGQMILADTLTSLKNQNIRVVYGDTDGIYLGCSNTAENLEKFSKSLGIIPQQKERMWLTKPEQALSAIEQCNSKWQKELDYPEFELEPETHDCMIFIKHKNYLIFDAKNSHILMTTKGNNFKGSDKANIARKVLEHIMIDVLKDNISWDNEENVRKNVKTNIITRAKEIISNLDLKKVDLDDLTLIQSVQPAKRYKLNQDGSTSTFAHRASALEKLLGSPIKTRIKLKFVVTKKPLPGILKPSKSGVKPIDYMYPIDLLQNHDEIDLEWYKKMIENYIKGAFGLSEAAVTEQTGLDAWM